MTNKYQGNIKNEQQKQTPGQQPNRQPGQGGQGGQGQRQGGQGGQGGNQGGHNTNR